MIILFIFVLLFTFGFHIWLVIDLFKTNKKIKKHISEINEICNSNYDYHDFI